ncbi:MAG: hypothetical protein DRP78_05020 [Candidatus Omnitrophota bacterium]|nr:MAG: hypothetical protein DRP78_05020 [Candidatus Omnitrophota bacterium]
MNILFVTTHLNYGGISSYTVSLSKLLEEKGHHIYLASAGGDMLLQLQEKGFEHIQIPISTKFELSPLVFFSIFKLLKFVRKNHIDVIHAHTRVTQVLAYYLSKITKVPFITTCHGFFKQNIGRRFLPCWGEKVIAVSDAVREHLKVDFALSEEKIVLIPNGIDIEQFKTLKKKTDSISSLRVVGIVARLSSVKGHKYLIAAMAKVIQKFFDARLFIFGEGRIKYALVRQAEQLKIKDKVFFLPSVTNTTEVLNEIDIFVMPSSQEGLGLSILEAQACGLPVIASNVGGIPSIVKDNLSGLLVPPENSDLLASAIIKLMRDRKMAMRLGQRARQDVENKFNIEQMVDKVEHVYNKVGG